MNAPPTGVVQGKPCYYLNRKSKESAILVGQEPLHVQILVHIQYIIRLKRI